MIKFIIYLLHDYSFNCDYRVSTIFSRSTILVHNFIDFTMIIQRILCSTDKMFFPSFFFFFFELYNISFVAHIYTHIKRGIHTLPGLVDGPAVVYHILLLIVCAGPTTKGAFLLARSSIIIIQHDEIIVPIVFLPWIQ
jgi:hypothetical protein